jgi:type II secretory pathway component GspD/PulD (secretin)
MKTNFKTLAASFAISTALFGCASQFDLSEESQSSPLRQDAKVAMQAARGTTYVREIRSENVALAKPIFLTRQGMALRSVLQEVLPGYAIIPGGKINLNDTIDIAARGMSLGDLIEYIEGTRDIDIKIEGNKVYVTNFETREWNLAAFAATRSVTNVVASTQTAGAQAGSSTSTQQQGGSTQGTSASVGYTLSEDEWSRIMAGARTILGVSGSDSQGGSDSGADSTSIGSGASGQNMVGADQGLSFDGGQTMPSGLMSDSDEMPAYIEGIRSVGIVTAGGTPSKMRILDRFFRSAIAESTKIVNVQVLAYDVILNDNKQKGIDWDAIVQGTINGNPFGLALNSVQQAATNSSPLWQVTGNFQSDHLTVNKMLLSFLQQYGRVELNDQPNLTVRNGVPAQIYAGQELTYIVDVEQAQDEAGNITVTPRLGRLKVGVTLSVTVRVLDNEQLLVDIWPVISNLGNNDTIQIGTFQFETPRVNLKEFSTQLITSSGRSVHLGGLITKRLTNQLTSLPWEGLVTKAIAPIMEDVNNDIERRELVLVVTPTLIEGVL